MIPPPGDTLVVTRLDRLARSTADLLGIVSLLETKGSVAKFGGGQLSTHPRRGGSCGHLVVVSDHLHCSVAKIDRHPRLGAEQGRSERWTISSGVIFVAR